MIPGVIPRIVSGPTYRIHKTVETGRDPGDDVVPGVWERNVLARVVEKTDDCGTDIVRNVFASPFHKSRFNDGSYGIWYAGMSVGTAIAETVHHHQIFLGKNQPGISAVSDFFILAGSVDRQLEDVNAVANARHPSNPAISRQLGADLRKQGSDGLVWDSVRHKGGECICLFKEKIVGALSKGELYSYHWDGSRIHTVKNETTGKAHKVTGTSTIRIR